VIDQVSVSGVASPIASNRVISFAEDGDKSPAGALHGQLFWVTGPARPMTIFLCVTIIGVTQKLLHIVQSPKPRFKQKLYRKVPPIGT
jgi:hypothetical protein